MGDWNPGQMGNPADWHPGEKNDGMPSKTSPLNTQYAENKLDAGPQGATGYKKKKKKTPEQEAAARAGQQQALGEN